jgi:hypothetical protein
MLIEMDDDEMEAQQWKKQAKSSTAMEASSYEHELKQPRFLLLTRPKVLQYAPWWWIDQSKVFRFEEFLEKVREKFGGFGWI